MHDITYEKVFDHMKYAERSSSDTVLKKIKKVYVRKNKKEIVVNVSSESDSEDVDATSKSSSPSNSSNSSGSQ
jgi:ATP phosphoribosyltransferase